MSKIIKMSSYPYLKWRDQMEKMKDFEGAPNPMIFESK